MTVRMAFVGSIVRPLGVASVVLAAAACGSLGVGESGSGTLETVEPDVGGFSQLVAEFAFDVTLSVGDDVDLVVRADDNVIDDVKASVSGDTLTLGLAGSYRDVTLEADLVVPEDALTSIRLSGAASVTGVDPLNADGFSIDASGASDVALEVVSNTLAVDASGASTVEMTGSGDVVDADASGASTLRLAGFDASTVTARADGASTVEVSASESLDADASGASTIRYSGDPSDVSSDASGGSTIEPA